MEKEKNYHDNGFLLGFIFGLLAMFLLGTKKGREILHKITEQGTEKMHTWKEMANTDAMLEDEHEDETDFVPQHASPKPSLASEKKVSEGRRFFRRQKKE